MAHTQTEKAAEIRWNSLIRFTGDGESVARIVKGFGLPKNTYQYRKGKKRKFVLFRGYGKPPVSVKAGDWLMRRTCGSFEAVAHAEVLKR